VQANSAQYVLRKKPPGKVLASAHAVEREFQVLAALKDTPVPVPKALCLCQDAAVIGTPFYVMEHVQASFHCIPFCSDACAAKCEQLQHIGICCTRDWFKHSTYMICSVVIIKYMRYASACSVQVSACNCWTIICHPDPDFVIAQLQGRIFVEPTLPELSPPERAAAYRQQAVTLAALHSVRPEQVNLQRYGRPAGYCARQVM